MNLPPEIAFHRYEPAAWLRVSGEDAAAFLQGQFTHDLRGLHAGKAAYGLWLNQKGKVVADSFILEGPLPGQFWVGSYFCHAEAIRRRLETYIVADDVLIEDLTTEWEAVSLIGDARGWEPGAPPPAAGVAFQGRRTRDMSWEWAYPKASAALVAEKLAGLRELSAADVERLRIGSGIPAVPRDIGPDDLPNEGGLEKAAISYEKGCYLGQEIIARLKSRGRTRRRLHRVAGPGPVPDAGASLWQGGMPAGKLRSAAASADGSGFVGLAMLAAGRFDPAQALSLSPGGPANLEANSG